MNATLCNIIAFCNNLMYNIFGKFFI